MRRLLAFVALAAALPSCLWSRFDEEVVNAPIELLERPSWVLGGYGTVLAGDPGREALLVGGYPLLSSAAVFSFPGGATSLRPGCEDLARCRLVGTPIAAGDRAGGTGCFAYGIGGGPEPLGAEVGLLGGCSSGELFKLALPPTVRDLFTSSLFKAGSSAPVYPGLVALASSGNLLAAGAPDLSLAFFFAGDNPAPVEVPAPAGADGSFARSVAIVGGKGPPLLAVGAPTQGSVYLFDTAGPTPALRACVRRSGAYGVVLHGFQDRGKRLLAVSDAESRVDILDLDKLPASDACAEAPKDAILDTLRCLDDDKVTGCSDGAFGYALASADLDNDGAPEVIVGAPGLNVRDVPNAGALAIFRIDPVNEQPRYLFLSSATADERVGTAVAAFRKDGRVVLASSALNKQKTPIFHCASSSPSERCR